MQNVERVWTFRHCLTVIRYGKVIFLKTTSAFIIGNSELKTGDMVKILFMELKFGFIIKMKGKKVDYL